MGHNLEELLDATGIGDMAGKQYEKTASAESEPFDLRKLAEQCRAAADATEAHREARGRELVEKTAAVAVISKTIDEINEIIGDPAEKFASDERVNAFVAEALDRGYPPGEIATFLKTAFLGMIPRGLQRGRAAWRAAAGTRLAGEGKKLSNLAKHEYKDLLRQAETTGSLNKFDRYVENISRKFGDKEAGRILRQSGVKTKTPAAERVLAASEEAAAKASLGGKSIQISKEKAKKYGPAAAAGTGMYIVGRRSGD